VNSSPEHLHLARRAIQSGAREGSRSVDSSRPPPREGVPRRRRSSHSSTAGVDFYQFWVVGQALGHTDVTDVYSTGGRRRLGAEYLDLARREANPRRAAVAEYRQTLETYSTPFLYAVLKTLSGGDYEIDFRNYRLLMLACLVLGVAILARLLGHSLAMTLGAIAVFSAWFAPFTSDMRVGNVNSIQLALLANLSLDRHPLALAVP